jgi:SAM-dependent methyltransferase
VHSFIDLGMAPLANSYLTPERLECMEPFYPLHARVCGSCFLVQLPETRPPSDIFNDYAYLSSYSDTWRKHVETFARRTVERFGFSRESHVVEIASNDGCLLRSFQDRGMRVLGIEPAANVAEIANASGIPTIAKFFGSATARALSEDGHVADLLVGNNVLAHVPDLHDFVEGLKIILAPQGILTMEFPHLLQLIEQGQFDTIYHEHFSYFSGRVVRTLFEEHGLRIFDVEEIPIHGGSLRIYADHAENRSRDRERSVAALLGKEEEAGLGRLETYLSFGEKARDVKLGLLEFLIEARKKGSSVAGYGAPAKGNTLLNYCGVRSDFVEYTVDRNPYKQGRFLPGTHIPIHPPSRIAETRPDFVLILPWNIREEISAQMADIRDWGGKFVVPIPRVEVFG